MTSEREIRAEIEAKIRADAEIRVKAAEFADDVRDYARSIAPVRTGAYAASIKVKKQRDHLGLPAYRVVATDWKAHLIEYGTGSDSKEGSPFGKDTPTPEFGVFGKTAHRFGGTLDGGITADQ